MPVATAEPKAVVAAAIKSMGQIATLPEVTSQIISIVEDPNSTARDLYQLVRTDPALSAKILKVVNSAFYGLPGQVATIDRAIVLLGLSAVKNIAIAASLARLFKGGVLDSGFDARELWSHSVAVGTIARMMAKHQGRLGSEEAFLAGLIHDLGMLIECQTMPRKLVEAIAVQRQQNLTLREAEQQVLGADHTEFGTALAEGWRFPRHLTMVIGYHHEPPKLAAPNRQLPMLIQAADILACREQLGLTITAEAPDIDPELLAELGLDADSLAKVLENLPEQLEASHSTLSVV